MVELQLFYGGILWQNHRENGLKNRQDRWNTMTEHTVTLEALQGQSLERLLQQVVEQRVTMTVVLPDGTEVVIEPKPRLKPLPVLEGHIPTGWKDAVYGRD
jgi:hypothetical protein